MISLRGQLGIETGFPSKWGFEEAFRQCYQTQGLIFGCSGVEQDMDLMILSKSDYSMSPFSHKTSLPTWAGFHDSLLKHNLFSFYLYIYLSISLSIYLSILHINIKLLLILEKQPDWLRFFSKYFCVCDIYSEYTSKAQLQNERLFMCNLYMCFSMEISALHVRKISCSVIGFLYFEWSKMCCKKM